MHALLGAGLSSSSSAVILPCVACEFSSCFFEAALNLKQKKHSSHNDAAHDYVFVSSLACLVSTCFCTLTPLQWPGRSRPRVVTQSTAVGWMSYARGMTKWYAALDFSVLQLVSFANHDSALELSITSLIVVARCRLLQSCLLCIAQQLKLLHSGSGTMIAAGAAKICSVWMLV